MTSPATPLPTTFEDQIAFLAAVVESTKIDDFDVKVYRKAALGAPLETIATFKAARVEHLRDPEVWLVPLCGAGPQFVLNVYHSQTPNAIAAVVTPPAIGKPDERRPCDPTVVARPGWRGPPQITHPTQAPQAQVRDLYEGMPGGTGQGQTGAAARGQPAVNPPGAPGSTDGTTFGAVQALLAIAEKRTEAQMDALKLAMETSAKANAGAVEQIGRIVERALTAQASQPKEDPVKRLVEVATALLPVAAPVITGLLASREKAATAALEREARHEERLAQERAEDRKRFDAMMERNANADANITKVVSPLVEAVALAGRSQLQMMAAMKEIAAGDQPPDEGIAGIVKAGLAAFAEMAAANRANAEARALPPHGAAPGTNGAAPPRPAAPVAAPAAPPPPDGGEVEESEEPAPSPEEDLARLAQIPAETLAGEVVNAIKAHHEPAALAGRFLDVLTAHEGLRGMVNTAGGILPFFQARLGGWITGNVDYVKGLIGALDVERKARGM